MVCSNQISPQWLDNCIQIQAQKKDAGYTIFYMGINAGAFLGSLLCGYLGEKIGWHYGFGLAGVFMFFGMLQFFFAQKIFGIIGDQPKGKGIIGETKKRGRRRTHAGECGTRSINRGCRIDGS